MRLPAMSPIDMAPATQTPPLAVNVLFVRRLPSFAGGVALLVYGDDTDNDVPGDARRPGVRALDSGRAVAFLTTQPHHGSVGGPPRHR